MPTSITDNSNLAIGLAKVYFGLSSTYIASTTQALSSEYFCGLSKVSIIMDKVLKERSSSATGIKLPIETKVISAKVQIKLDFIELMRKSLSFAAGGINSNANVINDLISDSTNLRTELVFTYPNGTSEMLMIFPVSNVVSSTGIDFSEKEPIGSSITITNLYTSNANWSSNPYGTVIFS